MEENVSKDTLVWFADFVAQSFERYPYKYFFHATEDNLIFERFICVDRRAMEDLEKMYYKTHEMLECFGQKKAILYFENFSKGKIGIEERNNLRQKLIKYIEAQKQVTFSKRHFYRNSLLQLGTKPKCPFASLSISHCPYLGAFVIVFDTKISIGLDMENIQRITKKCLYRIALKEEIVQSPSLALLWTAKEASFKCVSDQSQNLRLRECLISDWEKLHGKDIYFFKCHVKKLHLEPSLGVARFIDGFALAYAEWEHN